MRPGSRIRLVVAIALLAVGLMLPSLLEAQETAQGELARANRALKSNNLPEAKAAFESVYTRYPNAPEAARAMLSRAYLAVREKDPQTESRFRELAAKYPDSAEAPIAWLRVAYLRLKAREPDAAVYFSYVAEHYPGSVAAQEALFRLGRLAIREKNLDTAAAILERAADAPGAAVTKAQALVYLGITHIDRALRTKSEGDLEKGLEILLHIEDKYPKEVRSVVQGRVEAARLYAFVGSPAGIQDQAGARAILVETLERWPDSYFTMEAHTLIGLTYHYQNNNQAAVDYFENVVRKFPESNWNSMLLECIGDLNLRMGKRAEAADAWTRCIAFDPDTDWARSARKGLDSLSAVAPGP